MKVAIFDDSIQIINRLKELVLESGSVAEIEYAVSYEDAVSVITNKRPDIVILDLNFHGSKPYELLKTIKANFQQIKVIILSIHIEEEIQTQCLELGADYFFDKYHEFEKIPLLISQFAISK